MFSTEKTLNTDADVKRESVDCPQTRDGEIGGYLDTETTKLSQMMGAEWVQGGVPSKEAVPVFPLVSAKNESQLVNRKGTKYAENVIRLVYNFNFGAGQLRWQANRIDDCKRILNSSRDED